MGRNSSTGTVLGIYWIRFFSSYCAYCYYKVKCCLWITCAIFQIWLIHSRLIRFPPFNKGLSLAPCSRALHLQWLRNKWAMTKCQGRFIVNKQKVHSQVILLQMPGICSHDRVRMNSNDTVRTFSHKNDHQWSWINVWRGDTTKHTLGLQSAARWVF